MLGFHKYREELCRLVGLWRVLGAHILSYIFVLGFAEFTV